MTTQANIPAKWYVPFAQGDASRVEIPVTTADPTRASQTLGFPPLTMQPPESGGVPPQGEDFNGGMNQIARVAWWVLNGGGWPYDATFATNSNINGYPNGAKLQSADFRGDWINTTDGNQNNPDTTGTGWVPGFQYGVTALAGLTGGTVTPTPAQAAKGSITLAGTLTSALTIVLPTWLQAWRITNNTTGAFVTIVKTAAGSGVTIPQNATPTRVSGDGTNIVQSPENIAPATSSTQAMQLGQATGRLLGAPQIFSTAGTATYTPTAGMTFVIVEVQGGGGGGGGTQTTGASTVAVGSGGSSGSYAKARFTAATIGASQIVTVGAAGTFGGANGNGGNGGTSSLGALVTAPGGLGGGVGVATAPPFFQVPAQPGTAPTGGNILNVRGNPAVTGQAIGTLIMSGAGGGAPIYGGGGGAPYVVANTAGGNATAAGAGGAGGALNTNQAATNGGAGGAGVVIIWEYA